jgi:hypothetical protein
LLTLERARLVNRRNFKDAVMQTGNRCFLAKDYNLGKYTIIVVERIETAGMTARGTRTLSVGGE